jgi:penicillin-binding protein-related factor A (putative recombinase)
MQNKVEEAKEVLVNNEINLKFRLSGVDQITHLAYTYNLLGRCFLMTNELSNSEFYLSKAQDLSEKYDLGGIKYVVYITQRVAEGKAESNFPKHPYILISAMVK